MSNIYSIGGVVGFGWGGLISLEVVDQEGTQSDSLTMVFDGSIGGLPSMGAILPVQMGLTSLASMGRFIVDEISQDISKQGGLQNTIRCRAADIREPFKQQRTQDYHDKTLGDVLNEVAGRNGLSAQVYGKAAEIKYKYLAQTDESDLHFMTRLAKKHDCVGAPKNGKLVFGKKGEMPVGSIVVVPQMTIQASASQKSRPEHKEAENSYWNREDAERVYQSGGSGSGSAVHGVPSYAADGEEDAKETADSKGNEQKRATKSCSLTIVGNPAAMAEANLTVVGLGSVIDGQYRIKSATHRIDKQSGYQTSIEAELPE